MRGEGYSVDLVVYCVRVCDDTMMECIDQPLLLPSRYFYSVIILSYFSLTPHLDAPPDPFVAKPEPGDDEGNSGDEATKNKTDTSKEPPAPEDSEETKRKEEVNISFILYVGRDCTL